MQPNDLNESVHRDLMLRVALERCSARGIVEPPNKWTEPGLCDWISSAVAGQVIVYHEGFLLLDRSESTSNLSTKDRQRLNAIARRAWIACELGLVHLFSQRLGPGHFRYLAIRAVTSRSPPEIRTQLRTTHLAPRKSH